MGGCQNYGPFLDAYYNTAPNISGTKKGTIILTSTHMIVNRILHGGGWSSQIPFIFMPKVQKFQHFLRVLKEEAEHLREEECCLRCTSPVIVEILTKVCTKYEC